MDHRIRLKQHTVLSFDGMDCHVETVCGYGKNAIVYRGWYPDHLNPEQKHHVLIKELFPFHPQKRIQRGDDLHIYVEPEAQTFFETHRQSFLDGNKVHLRLLADHPERLGANLNSFALNGTLYSVLGYSGGRSLQEELTHGTESLRRHAMRMMELLDALEAFHKSGFLHLDIKPDNIMLTGEGDRERMFLIDYNSARRIESEEDAFLSGKAGYAAPEVESGDIGAFGFASDLYSVAAVFYRCIMGRSLTLEEGLNKQAPDGRQSPCLSQTPQTVNAQVAQILRKGLHVLPQKRYQSTGQMRRAFSELIDRIDCVGVTHWALWESGKRRVEERIRVNPALGYLREKEKLYPIRLCCGTERLDLRTYLDQLIQPEGASGLLLAEGGMGKTTLLLRCAQILGHRYTPSAPAVFYINLNGWNSGDSNHICTQILMSLRFSREMNTFDSAMHALHRLLDQPLKTKAGEIPSVLLLLDGLNEVRGDSAALLQEIHALSARKGVRILAASRSEIPELEWNTVSLDALQTQDVADVLGENGLLLPGDNAVMHLLRTPLILSLYVQASNGGQIHIQSEQELMQAYLDALYEKELRLLPEDSPQRWQIEAAISYVLPCVAAEEQRTGSALSETQLLRIVRQCWNNLNSRRIHRVFPQWIGHSADICAEAQTAEQWYGTVIHGILWRRLGLLIKEPSGGCRVYHQLIREYLSNLECAGFHRKQLRHRILAATAVGLTLLLGLLYVLVPKWYDDETVEHAIDYSASGYAQAGYQYEQLRQLLDFALAGDQDGFEASYALVQRSMERNESTSDTDALYLTYVETKIIPKNGSLVSWSWKPFDGNLSMELIRYADLRRDYYTMMLPLLAEWMHSEQAQQQNPEFAVLLSRLLEADAAVTSELYHQTVAVHLDKGDAQWQQNIQALIDGIPAQESHRTADGIKDRTVHLEELRSEMNDANRQLLSSILVSQWADCLNIYEQIYRTMNWAYNYAEAFAEDNTWGSLLKARAACHSALEAMNSIEIPENAVNQEMYELLMANGIEAEVISLEYDRLEETLLDNIQTMGLLLRYLRDDIYLSASADALGDWLTDQKQMLDAVCQYLCLTTNYMMLQLEDQPFWERLETDYPTVSRCAGTWEEDPQVLETETSAVLDQMEVLSGRQTAYLEIAEYTLSLVEQAVNTGAFRELSPHIHVIEDVPMYFPMPFWCSAESTVWHYRITDRTGSAHTVAAGEAIHAVPSVCILTTPAVSEADFRSYAQSLTTWGLEPVLEWAEDFSRCHMTVTVGKYSMELTWTASETTVTLNEPVTCLMPELYLIALLLK